MLIQFLQRKITNCDYYLKLCFITCKINFILDKIFYYSNNFNLRYGECDWIKFYQMNSKKLDKKKYIVFKDKHSPFTFTIRMEQIYLLFLFLLCHSADISSNNKVWHISSSQDKLTLGIILLVIKSINRYTLIKENVYNSIFTSDTIKLSLSNYLIVCKSTWLIWIRE